MPSTMELTDGSQNQTDTYRYYAFGKDLASSGSTVNPYQYVGDRGYYNEHGLGLQYLRSRWYDPTAGGFLSQDPVQDGLNWYVYCTSTPISNTDPNGLNVVSSKIPVDLRPFFYSEMFMFTFTITAPTIPLVRGVKKGTLKVDAYPCFISIPIEIAIANCKRTHNKKQLAIEEDKLKRLRSCAATRSQLWGPVPAASGTSNGNRDNHPVRPGGYFVLEPIPHADVGRHFPISTPSGVYKGNIYWAIHRGHPELFRKTNSIGCIVVSDGDMDSLLSVYDAENTPPPELPHWFLSRFLVVK